MPTQEIKWKMFVAAGSFTKHFSFLPANIVRFADPQLGQAVGLLLLLVGAGRHDGLAAALGAGRVGTGAEQQLVGVVGRDAVEELPQRLVALGPVARAGAGGRLDARRHVFRTQLLTRLVDVARLGGVQAAVHRRHFGLWAEEEDANN